MHSVFISNHTAHICRMIVSLVLSFSFFTHFAQPSDLLSPYRPIACRPIVCRPKNNSPKRLSPNWFFAQPSELHVESVHEFVFVTFCLHMGRQFVSLATHVTTAVGLHKMLRHETISRGGLCSLLQGGGKKLKLRHCRCQPNSTVFTVFKTLSSVV